jgi:Zn-finger domain-containing protein
VISLDEDIIDDIAYAFSQQLEYLDDISSGVIRGYYQAAILDAIESMAEVINNHNQTYDLRYFYKNCGYPEPYPQHSIR